MLTYSRCGRTIEIYASGTIPQSWGWICNHIIIRWFFNTRVTSYINPLITNITTITNITNIKTPAPRRRAPLGTIKAGYPMQIIAVDILGPLPESTNGNSYILVVGDYFTRWMDAYAIRNQEAATVAQKLVDEIFYRFSTPEQLHSVREASLSHNWSPRFARSWTFIKAIWHPITLKEMAWSSDSIELHWICWLLVHTNTP